MTRFLPLAALLVFSAPALAEAQMSAAEFEAYVTGKTLYFAQNGQAYGVEEYLPDRRVRWSFLDGDCIEGEWYADGPMICFSYENRDAPQCWEFHLGARGLSARVSTDPAGLLLYEVAQSGEPMVCLGPKIGV